MKVNEKIGVIVVSLLGLASLFYLFRQRTLFLLPLLLLIPFLLKKGPEWWGRFRNDDPADWWKKGRRD